MPKCFYCDAEIAAPEGKDTLRMCPECERPIRWGLNTSTGEFGWGPEPDPPQG